MVKPAFLVMDLGVDPTNENDYDWITWWHGSSQGRGAPLLPDRFKEQLEDKSFTNGKDDKPLVAELYRKSFEACFGQATELVYSSLGWGAAQAAALATVLGAGAAPKLKKLNLGWNSIGDEGARALAQALPGVPALENLKCAPPARPPAPMPAYCVRALALGLL